MAQVVKNPVAMQEMQETQERRIRPLGREDPLEKEMANLYHHILLNPPSHVLHQTAVFLITFLNLLCLVVVQISIDWQDQGLC